MRLKVATSQNKYWQEHSAIQVCLEAFFMATACHIQIDVVLNVTGDRHLRPLRLAIALLRRPETAADVFQDLGRYLTILNLQCRQPC